jgi:hypothetical protein
LPAANRRIAARSPRSTIASSALDDVIAEAKPATGLAILYPTTQPAARLVRQILQEQGVHRALEADKKRGDVSLREDDDTHTGESHPLEETGNVFLITAQPVHCFRQDDSELPARSIADEFLDAGTKQGRTGDGAIGVAVDDRPALFLGVDAAEPQLIFNRSVALIVGRIAGV